MRATDRPGSAFAEGRVESKFLHATRTKGAPTYLPSASKGSTRYPLRLISSSVRMIDLFEPDIAVPDWIHLCYGGSADRCERPTHMSDVD